MMYRPRELRVIASTFMAYTGMTQIALSSRIKPSSKRLIETLMEGREIGVFSAELASDWFPRNWPVGLPWPLGDRRTSARLAEALELGASAHRNIRNSIARLRDAC